MTTKTTTKQTLTACKLSAAALAKRAMKTIKWLNNNFIFSCFFFLLHVYRGICQECTFSASLHCLIKFQCCVEQSEYSVTEGDIIHVAKVKVDESSRILCSKTLKQSRIPRGNTVYTDFQDWILLLLQEYLALFPIDTESGDSIRNVKNALFTAVQPKPFKTQVQLVAVAEDALIDCLDLSMVVTKSSFFMDFISGNNKSGLFPPSLAHRYGGHQFGYWAGQLGDGRALLLGVYTNKFGERWELQLKGSGTTPYSRHGDGRAVLRSSVREFLASVAMYYLGVPTSRAVSIVVSDDDVIRDQFYDGHPVAERGAIVLRLAQSWFRIGSLEILSHAGEITLLRSLLDHIIKSHYKHIDLQDKNKYLLLFQQIVAGTAKLIAKWQNLGFTHGVCNTDNFSILSITIDYGPFGFMDDYYPNFVPNTSDDERRYSYQNQPSVGFYNLEKLLQALQPVLEQGQYDTAKIVLRGYDDEYHQSFMKLFAKKLGFSSVGQNDELIAMVFFKIMQDTKADFTMSFRQLGEIPLKQLLLGKFDKEYWALLQLKTHNEFKQFLDMYKSRLELDGVEDKDRRAQMMKHNPRYVLRNWMAQKAILQAERNDFSEVQKLYRILKQPFIKQEEAEISGYSNKPPSWASHVKVSCSS